MAAFITVVFTSISVVMSIVAFALSVKRDSAAGLPSHLTRALAAGAVPSGFMLLVGALFPALLSQIPGLNLPIALGGLSLLYISAEVIVRREA